jgi:hypothetical protein
MKLSLKKFFTSLSIVTLSVAAFAFVSVEHAFAAAPAGTSATLSTSTSSTVTILITGTDFATFISSGTTTANATDRAKITYNSQNPTTATSNGTTTITAVFPIATGTGKSGGALTIAADALQDGSSVHNTLITIATGSITDSSKPQVLSVSPADSATSWGRGNSYVIVFSEPMTTATFDAAFSTTPTETYSSGVWSTTTRSNDTVTVAHGVLKAAQSYTASISTGLTDAATSPNAISAYSWGFTTKTATSATYGGDINPTEGAATTSGSTGSTDTSGSSNSSSNTTPPASSSNTDANANTQTPGLIITAVPPAPVVIEGCVAGAMFSTVNGKSCAGAAVMTPPAPSYNFGTVTLRVGSKNDGVKSLQAFLNAKLNAGLTVDGSFGKMTAASVKAWQAANGLTADGVVGVKTMTKMSM